MQNTVEPEAVFVVMDTTGTRLATLKQGPGVQSNSTRNRGANVVVDVGVCSTYNANEGAPRALHILGLLAHVYSPFTKEKTYCYRSALGINPDKTLSVEA